MAEQQRFPLGKTPLGIQWLWKMFTGNSSTRASDWQFVYALIQSVFNG
ncbi:MAG: hypothetical protein NTY87_00395 [Planctomycetia bacterium]|nr:hypothetical protein [Planctomycetia bacterium]